MSTFYFPLKTKVLNQNRNNNLYDKMYYSVNLQNNNNNNNFLFNLNHNKNKNNNTSNCESCPSNNKSFNINDKTLEKELLNQLNEAEKNLELWIKGETFNQPCKNCGLENIGFDIKNDDGNYILVSIPKYYLNLKENYHFENITILDKNNNYIEINKNTILNNSKEKLTINLYNLYNNLRIPLVLTAKCVLPNKTFYINGYLN